ncbi:hypothetical protein PPOLYM_02556 [Paenibacillus polymyxa]|uniref:hypothetical protein n=1 Tax=Paenibacillus polymyxa TaxID=1406 RepID=UPI0009475572|nr:hypothetical protein [Paenibacillus polymyxa]APQ59817.1 hypothetical protein VK72_14425 [Paenibacillus polymyxa]VUG06163.1 hypothetical protein PPOLYM_02556 [Paenibacillus polymyxa]
MKAVPKINTDGLYLEDKLVDDTFSGVVPFYSDNLEQDSEKTEQDAADVLREPVIAGYIVGVPFPEGFSAYVTEDKAFRFNLETLLWEEGLTVEEIAELTKPTDQGQDASEVVGQQLAEMKIQAMQQTQLLASMGAELAAAKLEIIDLKGANQS